MLNKIFGRNQPVVTKDGIKGRFKGYKPEQSVEILPKGQTKTISRFILNVDPDPDYDPKSD